MIDPVASAVRLQKIRDWQDSRRGFQYGEDIEFLLNYIDQMHAEIVHQAHENAPHGPTCTPENCEWAASQVHE